MRKRYINPGTSLVVQYLRLYTANAEQPGSIPGQGTRPAKTWCSQFIFFFLSINIKEAEKRENLLGRPSRALSLNSTGTPRESSELPLHCCPSQNAVGDNVVFPGN